jgi:hypothetical protein
MPHNNFLMVLTGILFFVTRPPLASVLSSVAALSIFMAYSIHYFHDFCLARDSARRAVWSGANTSRMGLRSSEAFPSHPAPAAYPPLGPSRAALLLISL